MHQQWSTGLAALCAAGICTLTGCSGAPQNFASLATSLPFNGVVHGGQQPVSGAVVQLFAVGTGGYGSSSLPLGSAAVTSDRGNFTLGNNLCPSPSTLVYITATGGNPGLGAGQSNPQIAAMAALGPCSNLTANTFITINEVTTAAAVWSLAPFMIDYGHVGSSLTNQAGITNAFGSAASLANVFARGVPGTLPPNVAAPVAEVNTIANILAACVNSAGGAAGDKTTCGNFFAATTPAGAAAPTDTISAALAMAQNPGANVAALFQLQASSAPFQPALTKAPNDWTVTVAYDNLAMQRANQYINIAIDAQQNVWLAYGGSSSRAITGIFEFAQDLSMVSPASGYTDPSLDGPYALAFDLTGNVWVVNVNTTTVSEFAANGAYLKTLSGGGLVGPGGIAVDGSNNIWVANFGQTYDAATQTFSAQQSVGVSEFTNSGVALSPASGYTGGGAGYYQNGLAMDSSGNAWVSAAAGLALLGPMGTAISPPGTYGPDAGNTVAIDGAANVWTQADLQHVAAYRSNGQEFSPAGGFPGGGLQGGYGVAVDGANHIWLVNTDSAQQPIHVGTLSEFAQDGKALSPATGYAPTLAGSLNLAVDRSGNIWWAGVGTLYKCIGVAAPVMTPISVATATAKLGVRP